MKDANEISKELGISKVTVYEKFKKHPDLIAMKGQKKYATEELVSLIKEELRSKGKLTDEGIKAENEGAIEIATSLEESRELSELINLNSELINTLTEQLKIKDKQLEEKDRQIAELQDIIKHGNKLIENSQVLLKEKQEPKLLEERFHSLDEKLELMRERMESRHEEENSKKGFWSKFKGNK